MKIEHIIENIYKMYVTLLYIYKFNFIFVTTFDIEIRIEFDRIFSN